MMEKVANPRERTPWMLISLLVMSILAVILGGFLLYQHERLHIKQSTAEQLAAIADLKLNQIREWRSERRGDALAIMQYAAVFDQLHLVLRRRSTSQQERAVRSWLQALCDNYDYDSIILLDLSLQQVLTVGSAHQPIGVGARERALEAITKRDIVLSDLHRAETVDSIHLDLLVPIAADFKRASPVIGVLLLRIDPGKVLYPLILSWPTPSPTAETILIRREGNEVLFLNELRHRANTALHLRLPVSDPSLPAALAAQGTEGIVEGVDYRGAPVLAVTRRVPDSPWYLIAKVDQAEIYAPIAEQARTIAIIVILIIVAVATGLAAYLRAARARSYQRLFESEIQRKALAEHFGLAARNAKDVILLVDRQLKIVEVNDAILSTYGFAHDDLVGHSVVNLRAPETRSEIFNVVEQVDRSGSASFETLHQRKDGSVLPVEGSAKLIQIDGENFYHIILRDISDRKRAEEQNTILAQALRSISECVSITDLDDHVLFVNDAFLKTYGYSQEELAGQPIAMIRSPNNPPEATARILSETLRGGWQGELINRRKDGTDFPVFLSTSIVRNNLQQPAALIGVATDITERRRAQRALQASQERLQLALEGADLGLWDWDITTDKVVYDRRWAEMLEYDLSDIDPHITTWERLVHPADVAKAQGALNAHLQGDVPHYESEHRLRTKSGAYRWILDRGKIVERDAQGRPLRMAGTHLDITERKQSRQRLEESERRYRLLTENVPTVAWMTDERGKTTFISSNIREVYGFSAEEVLADPTLWLGRIHPEDHDRVGAAFRELFSTDRPFDVEYRIRRKDKEWIWLQDRANIVEEHNGVRCAYGVFSDITERKRAELALLDSEIRYRTLFEAAGDAIFIMEGETFVDCNPKTLEMFRCTREQILQHTPFDFSPPVQPDGSSSEEAGRRRIAAALEGNPQSFEWVHRRPDGSVFDVEVTLNLADLGEQRYIQAIVRDITERKRGMQALQESEARYRALVEHSPDAIAVHAEGKLVYANQAAAALIGAGNKEELIGTSVLNYVHPDSRRSAVQRIKAVMAGEPAPPDEERFVRLDGSVIDVEVTSIPYFHRGARGAQVIVRDVTERNQALGMLRESDRRMSEMLENVRLASVMLDTEGRITFCNKYLLELSGRMAGEVVGENWFDTFIPEELRPTVRSVFLKTISAGEFPTYFENEIVAKSGERRLISWSNTVLHDLAGNIIGTSSIGEDITESKQAQEALQDSQERLKILFDYAPDAFFLVSNKSILVDANRAAEHLFGMKLANMAGRSVLTTRLLPSAEVPRAQALLTGVILGDRTGPEEFTIQRLTGEKVSAEFTAYPVKIKGETLVLIIARDITQRRQYEESLQKLLAAVEQTDEVIFMTDPEGVISYVNPAFEQLYGYARVEAVGKTPRILRSGRMPADYYPKFWEDILSGKSVRSEHINTTRDGSIVVVEASVNPIHNVEGTLTGFIAVQSDVTHERQMEEERQNLERQFLQMQKLESIGTLAGGIAHDFNNILGIILGYVSSFRLRVPKPEQLTQAIEAIEKAVERGSSLVKQILTFARKTDMVYGVLDVNVLLKELTKMMKETFPRTIAIKTSLGKEIPTIIADATQIHQAFLNICVNARDAMLTGGTLSIATEIIDGSDARHLFSDASEGSYLHVSIDDTGSGMDEQTKLKIFEPFFTTKEMGKGTGLGLAVAYGAIKNHKGFISVDSEVGKGSTFHLYLPAPQGTPSDADAIAMEEMDVPGGTETLLFVEDEELLLDIVRTSIESKGYTLITAKDGMEGVEQFERYRDRIDLLISDLGLPRISGENAYKMMKKFKPGLKAIFASGYIEPDLRASLLKLGACDFVQKPYQARELLLAIRAALDDKPRKPDNGH